MTLLSFTNQLEALDRAGALRPIAFHRSVYSTGPIDPSSNGMVFREEEPFRAWRHYRWPEREPLAITPLYSPWQMLYLDDVVRGDGLEVPLAAFRTGATITRYAGLLRPMRSEERRVGKECRL